MTTVGAFEAKTKFSALLKRVAQGEVIEITQRGVPVARLVPANADKKQEEIDEAFRKFREMRKGTSLGGLKIRDLINEGRRY